MPQYPRNNDRSDLYDTHKIQYLHNSKYHEFLYKDQRQFDAIARVCRPATFTPANGRITAPRPKRNTVFNYIRSDSGGATMHRHASRVNTCVQRRMRSRICKNGIWTHRRELSACNQSNSYSLLNTTMLPGPLLTRKLIETVVAIITR